MAKTGTKNDIVPPYFVSNGQEKYHFKKKKENCVSDKTKQNKIKIAKYKLEQLVNGIPMLLECMSQFQLQKSLLK